VAVAVEVLVEMVSLEVLVVVVLGHPAQLVELEMLVVILL